MEKSHSSIAEEHDEAAKIPLVDVNEDRNSTDSLAVISSFFTVDRHHFCCINLVNADEDIVIQSLHIQTEERNDLLVRTFYNSESRNNPKDEFKLLTHSVLTITFSAWGSQFPIRLKPWEKHSCLFLLNVSKIDFKSMIKDIEIQLSAVLQIENQRSNLRNKTIVHVLPFLRIKHQPLFTMTAECNPPVVLGDSCEVKYTVTNYLQDFRAIYILWDSPTRARHSSLPINQSIKAQESRTLICHKPLSNLGFCREGSKLQTTVCFSVTKEGVYEVGQHMKLKLHYTTEPLTITNSPSSLFRKPDQKLVTSFSDINFQSYDDQSSVVLALDRIIKQPCEIYFFKSFEKVWKT
ncbi:trafficking protein particle complex subunit 14-like [Tachypleus tridentatus]|uniref:trafficking protein particle complex subunit 14-like n=1 Tax=Tachypleus tridentatus TaxID=6853 RepID=UPI003FD614DD